MTTETTVTGSLAPIPYNSRAMRRVSPNANANPSASPTPVSHTPCNSTSLSTSIREAPRATRNPISRLVLLQGVRSEEHTSELQSHVNLVCRLLLEKKKKKNQRYSTTI